MRNLLQMVEDAALYRRGGDDVALRRRPAAIFCHLHECQAAFTAFTQQFNRLPACFAVMEDVQFPDNKGQVPFISKDELRARQDLLVWVYGENERKKGIMLAAYGIRDFAFAVDPTYRDVRYAPDLLREHRDEMERLFAMLADEESKLTLASIIKYRLRGEHGFLRIAEYAEYSHPQVKACPCDWVVDGGAFNGETSFQFALQSPGGKVFAFEPDPNNQMQIQNLLSAARASGDTNAIAAANMIEIAPYAIYDRDTTLRFTAGQHGSSAIAIDVANTIEIPAMSLDSYIAQRGIEKLDLVSLDVEGAEPEALHGMRNALKKFRPKLQISIYHHKDHLFSLPFLAQELCEDYVYFMGHHNTYSTETDLYCIPKEKLAANSP